mmetsp:Transcript_53896/g.128357  ORF Transcript_53896/g.128357 Transcript_53896/m.128357 type:complete len:235 (-) Transcript_53896:766-1470(-)
MLQLTQINHSFSINCLLWCFCWELLLSNAIHYSSFHLTCWMLLLQILPCQRSPGIQDVLRRLLLLLSGCSSICCLDCIICVDDWGLLVLLLDHCSSICRFDDLGVLFLHCSGICCFNCLGQFCFMLLICSSINRLLWLLLVWSSSIDHVGMFLLLLSRCCGVSLGEIVLQLVHGWLVLSMHCHGSIHLMPIITTQLWWLDVIVRIRHWLSCSVELATDWGSSSLSSISSTLRLF